MILLDSTTRTLEVLLAGAITTNQLPWTASYVDISTASTFALSAAAASNGATNSGTAVTMVSAPAASTSRQIKLLTVFNADTVAATVTVRLNDNGTTRIMWKGVLQTAETLTFVHTAGFVVTDANGAPKTNLIDEDDITLVDVTTLNVTSTKHGLAPKSGGSATTFLNGAATPAYAAVKDSDLSTSDITTNDVSTSKHGFVPKATGLTTQFLNANAAYSASGQIPFPASQNASSDVNTLDDYEEGSWTPVIGGSGGTSGQTYTTQTGHYVKIGKLVFAAFAAVLSAKGTITTNVQIQGLPFASDSSLTNIARLSWGNLATNWVTIEAQLLAGATAATVVGAAAAAANSNNANLATADINNNSQFLGFFVYRASA